MTSSSATVGSFLQNYANSCSLRVTPEIKKLHRKVDVYIAGQTFNVRRPEGVLFIPSWSEVVRSLYLSQDSKTSQRSDTYR